MSFYVTLISDSSLSFFPDNKISHFTTQLPRPIELRNGAWEMALVDFVYPHTWYNIREDNNLYVFDVGDNTFQAGNIPVGYYSNVAEVLKNIKIESPNTETQKSKSKLDLYYNPVSKKIKYQLHDRAKLILSPQLAGMLGFEYKDLKGSGYSTRAADLKGVLPIMYVYCDLVEPQIVGDVQAPLLKIVNVKGHDGEIININFPRPVYLPIIRQHFQTIHVDIRQHSGALVPFESGKVFLTLHFRLRQIV
ncbi:hypothetical protein RF55_16786 [Lasius niger]|uniref:Uncharacterized protein n=1 Tax=Lasius niger TaxID=67767 RepID=A0A0J7K458_LASNI|nr:hypothetical protein RF55_16786 [Lasius niger]